MSSIKSLCAKVFGSLRQRLEVYQGKARSYFMTGLVEYSSLIFRVVFDDRVVMKVWITLCLLFTFSASAWSASGVKGKVLSPKDCSSPVMVWLSLDKDDYKERLLLLHTEVPVGGTFQFYLKPGQYQLRASDQKGCEFLQRITVEDVVNQVEVKMVKK